MSTDFLSLLSPQRLTEVVDVGANLAAGGDPPYAQMLASGLCRVTGFDPEEGTFRGLRGRNGNPGAFRRRASRRPLIASAGPSEAW
jgi:hypothetical protein